MASCSKPAKKEAEGESYTNEPPNWLELPKDVTTNILGKLDVVDILMSASPVCSSWWNICKDPLMWRTIHMSKYHNYSIPKLEKICRIAVERSCGLMEDITIQCFATDDLLKYIVESSSHLRRVVLNCFQITDNGMRDVAKKLPLLEELDISYCGLSKNSLEAIGQGCPLMKVLKLEIYYPSDTYIPDYDLDGMAFAIAKTMPGLRHLQFWGESLSDEGLLAFLDGCPLLECLDLLDCRNVDFSGGLLKRCLEQIKEFRLPTRFVNDLQNDDICHDYGRYRVHEDDLSLLIDRIADSDFEFRLKRWFGYDDGYYAYGYFF